jgi:OOP family OmpA-OmpF porin
MPTRTFLFNLAALLLSGAACLGAALWAVGWVEQRSLAAVAAALADDGHDWVEADTDGMRVILTGLAPDEPARFRALTVAGQVVDGARLVDEMRVAPPDEVPAPAYQVEILRNDADISLIGLVPSAGVREDLRAEVRRIAGSVLFTDLLETAEGTLPERWDEAMAFGLQAVASLPRSKVSISADRVSVTALAESTDEKRRIEAALSDGAPSGVALGLDIAAPRPVIAPFTARFTIGDDGATFDSCSAATEDGLARILRAAHAAGIEEAVDCPLGLGVPSTRWDEAVVMAIEALERLGGGSVTFSDGDVTLIARQGTDPTAYDAEIGALERSLPPVFALHAMLPAPPEATGGEDGEGPARFTAARSPEGLVQIRGRLARELDRQVVEGFAHARFGAAETTTGIRVDDAVPDGWTPRVLASLDALGYLAQGSVTVTAEDVEISGETGDTDARRQIARLLSEKLGGGADFEIDVTYVQEHDPNAGLPTPRECVRLIQAAAADQKITFAPSSAEFDPESRETLDRIAGILRRCGPVPMEIAGYTDSQGRESMNQALSQERADAVLTALMSRRILTSGIEARGYGEENPIADNDTEEGREANRRIEFHYTGPEDTVEARTGPH